MKKYTVQEMFEEKEGTKFKDAEGDIYIIKNRTVLKSYGDYEERELLLNKKWFETSFVKIQELVSFMEAVNAGLEGKIIKVDVTELNKKYRDTESGTCVLNGYWNNSWSSIKYIFEMLSKTEKHTDKIINEGKWYIKED